MRILYMGTADFAVPALEQLVASRHEVLGVVTQPDKPVGRKRELQPSPVKRAALELGLMVFQPERLRRDAEFHDAVRAMEPDLVAYAAYGQIIPQAFLDIPRFGCWNIHGSLLPKYRGAAPIQRAVMNGDSETGVCVMVAEAGLDTGPVLAARRMGIGPEDTAGTIAGRMAAIGAGLLLETIDGWEAGSITPDPQDESQATVAPSIEKADARLQWNRPAVELANVVRGLNPKPGAWTLWRDQEFKVWSARAAHEGRLTPGQVTTLDGQVLAGTGDGAVELVTVQPSGKRPMPAIDWARGLRGAEQFD